MSLHDSLLVSPTESLVLGRVEAQRGAVLAPAHPITQPVRAKRVKEQFKVSLTNSVCFCVSLGLDC